MRNLRVRRAKAFVTIKHMNQSTETALFALGNFWEPEYEFGKLHGVVHAEAGYAGGTTADPTYHNIGDHSEAVQIDFDPHAISYEQLLDKFWHLHDPTAEYEPRFRSIIFYFDETQHDLAEESKKAMQEQFDEPIVTEIIPAGKFYTAESYNQDYLARLRGEI
jgi:peptide-methionine (S)-S-oxide reductase